MATAKVVIKSENQIKKGLKSAEQDLQGFESKVAKMSKAVQGLFALEVFNTATAAIGKLVGTASQCIDAYKTQEKAETKLSQALKVQGQYTRTLNKEYQDLASSLQGLVAVGDETILEMESLLVATGNVTKKGMKPALMAALDLSAALGTDAVTSARTLAKVLADPAKNFDSLKRSNIQFTEAEKEQIKTLQESNQLFEAQSLVLKKIESAYGGFAKEIGSTDTAQIQKILDVIGDIKEELGKGLLNALEGVFEYTLTSLQAIYDFVKRFNNTTEARKQSLAISKAPIEEKPAMIADADVEALVNVDEDLVALVKSIAIERARSNMDIGRANLYEVAGARATHGTEDEILAAVDEYILRQNEIADRAKKGELTGTDALTLIESGLSDVVSYNEQTLKSIDEEMNSSLKTALQMLEEARKALELKTTKLTVDNDDDKKKEDDHTIKIGDMPNILSMFAGESKTAQIEALKSSIDIIKSLIPEFMNVNGPELQVLKEALASQEKKLEELTKPNSKGGFWDGSLNYLMDSFGQLGQQAQTLVKVIGSSNPFIAALKVLLQAIVQNLLPALSATLAPLMDAFDWIAQQLANTLLPILDALYPVIQMLAEDLMTSMKPILDGTITAVNTLLPLINLAAKAFVYVEAGAQFLADCISYVGQCLNNLGKFVRNVIKHPLRVSKWDDGMSWSFKTSAWDNIDERLAAIDAGSSVATDATSTTTAISSAGYQGATQVTINIYQQAPVVGSNGMTEFARIIRNEFDRLDYYAI